MNKANPLKEISRYLDNSNDNTTKKYRVLKAFINGWRGHRFNAEVELHDHCLHSTVSSIERKPQITIQRKWVTVKGYKGKPTRVKIYWVRKEDRDNFLNRLKEDIRYE